MAHVMLEHLRAIMRAVRTTFVFGLCAALAGAVWSCSLDGDINPQPLPPGSKADDDGAGAPTGARDAGTNGSGDFGQEDAGETPLPDPEDAGGEDGSDAGDLDGGTDQDGGADQDAGDGGEDGGDAASDGGAT